MDRDVHVKTDLLKVCFDLYCYHCCYLFHWDIYITLVCLFIRCGAEYSYVSRLNVCDVSLKSFKEFKAFWTCYFASPSVKVTDTFWRVRGQITSRVENMAYESMRAIYFHTNTKWYLPHYSYIFRKLYPLWTKINNVPYSRLGTMLYLDIQKGGRLSRQ